jgi:hypothetical protein
MRTPEYGEVGPETARTMRQMEDEYRSKLGLTPRSDDRIMVRYCAHPDGHAPKDCPDEIIPSDKMIALRDKWSGRNDR